MDGVVGVVLSGSLDDGTAEFDGSQAARWRGYNLETTGSSLFGSTSNAIENVKLTASLANC